MEEDLLHAWPTYQRVDNYACDTEKLLIASDSICMGLLLTKNLERNCSRESGDRDSGLQSI